MVIICLLVVSSGMSYNSSYMPSPSTQQDIDQKQIGFQKMKSKEYLITVEKNSHGGKPFFTVGNYFPHWGTISHCGICSLPSLQTPIHRDIHREGAAIDGCLEARQGGNPTVENHFPPWEMVSHRGNWVPTVENDFPMWEIISHRLPRLP